MPTVVVASPKGGVGKTSTSIILGLTLAGRGARVTLIDADRNHPLIDWHDGQDRPVKVIGGLTDETFVKTLDAEAQQSDIVIVDLEGTASRIMSRAILRADLVLIPLQPSALDAKQAGRAVGLVRQEEELMRRQIPVRLVFTRTAADKRFRTRIQKQIITDMEANNVSALETEIAQREPYKAIFEHRCGLADLAEHKVSGVPQAIENANALADEVEAILRRLVMGAAA